MAIRLKHNYPKETTKLRNWWILMDALAQQTDYSLTWYILQIYNTRYLDASQAGHKRVMPLLCEYSKLPSADWQHHFCNYT